MQQETQWVPLPIHENTNGPQLKSFRMGTLEGRYLYIGSVMAGGAQPLKGWIFLISKTLEGGHLCVLCKAGVTTHSGTYGTDSKRPWRSHQVLREL